MTDFAFPTNSISDMIYDAYGEYFTDHCKSSCFAEVLAESTLNLKVIHWEFRYHTSQHPCDLINNFNTLDNKVRWNIDKNSEILIDENAFENAVCKMMAILSRPQMC